MALIKCEECGKQVSDKASACPHCGCPIEKKIKCEECGSLLSPKDKVCPNCGCPIKKMKNTKNKKATNNKVLNEKTYKYWLLYILFIYSILIVFSINNLTFSFLPLIIILPIYYLILFLIYRFLNTKTNLLFDKKMGILSAIMIIPLIVIILLNTQSSEWRYNNFANLKSDNLEYYSIKLNIFGKCHYYYSNLDKNIDIKTNDCSYEKSDDKYTFYMTNGSEKTSFDCFMTNGKLRCPLQYTYPKKYIDLERE